MALNVHRNLGTEEEWDRGGEPRPTSLFAQLPSSGETGLYHGLTYRVRGFRLARSVAVFVAESETRGVDGARCFFDRGPSLAGGRCRW